MINKLAGIFTSYCFLGLIKQSMNERIKDE